MLHHYADIYMTSENITRVGKRVAHVTVKNERKNVKILFSNDKGQ